MTLFNIDKGSDGARLNPTVNSADVQDNPKAHATESISPRAQGTQGAPKITTKNTRIIANDGSNNIGLFGFDDAGAMVVKVAKPGFDANSAGSTNLIFNSSQNVFKIVQTGTGTMPIATYNTTSKILGFANANTTIAHGLSYTPICMGFITSFAGSAASQLLPATNVSGGSGVRTVSENYQITADSTNVYLTSTISYVSNAAESRNDSSIAYTIKYYLLQETAS